MSMGIPAGYGEISSRASDYGFIVVFALIIWACVMLAAFAGYSWYEAYQSSKRQEYLYSHVAFMPGEIVRSRIANFRGVVTAVSCYESCEYRVRFPVNSMEPIWMQPGELEKAQ